MTRIKHVAERKGDHVAINDVRVALGQVKKVACCWLFTVAMVEMGVGWRIEVVGWIQQRSNERCQSKKPFFWYCHRP